MRLLVCEGEQAHVCLCMCRVCEGEQAHVCVSVYVQGSDPCPLSSTSPTYC